MQPPDKPFPAAIKQRRVSLASTESPRLADGWTFRDDTGINAQQSSSRRTLADRKGKARRTDQSSSSSPVRETPAPDVPPVEKKPRKKWSEEETKTLIKGCQTHGVGNWKTILQDPNFKFHNRTAVDLKDRFRTYFPDAYKFHYPNAKTHLSSKVRSTLPDGTSLFEKTRSKRRRPFTEEEDRALKAGYDKHGTTWATIVKDPIFQEQNRRSTDLRDRFRNAFPDLYQLAGYKPRATVKKKMAAAEAATAAAAAAAGVVSSSSSSAFAGPSSSSSGHTLSAGFAAASSSTVKRAVTDDHLDLSTGGLGPIRSRRRAQTSQGLLLRGGTKSVPQSTAPSEDEDSSAGEEESESSQSHIFKTPPLPVFVDNVSTGDDFSTTATTATLASKLKKLDVDPFIMMPTTSTKLETNGLDDNNGAGPSTNLSHSHSLSLSHAHPHPSTPSTSAADAEGMEFLRLDSLAEPLNIPDFLPSSAHSSLDNTPWSSGIDTPTHSSAHAWSTAAASPTSSHFSDYLMTNPTTTNNVSSSHSSPAWERKTDLVTNENGDGMIGKSAWGAHDWFSPNPKLDHSTSGRERSGGDPTAANGAEGGATGTGAGALSPVSPFSPASSTFQPLGGGGAGGGGAGQYHAASFPGTPSAGNGAGDLSEAESDAAAYLGIGGSLAATNPANLFLHNHHLAQQAAQQQAQQQQQVDSNTNASNNDSNGTFGHYPSSLSHSLSSNTNDNNQYYSPHSGSFNTPPGAYTHTQHYLGQNQPHHAYSHHHFHHHAHSSILNTPSSSAVAFSPSSAFSDDLFGSIPASSASFSGGDGPMMVVSSSNANPTTANPNSTQAYHSQIAGDLMIAGNTRMMGSAVGSGLVGFGVMGFSSLYGGAGGLFGSRGGASSRAGAGGRTAGEAGAGGIVGADGGLGALGLVGIDDPHHHHGDGMDQSADGDAERRRVEDRDIQEQNHHQQQHSHQQSQTQSGENGSSGNTLEEVGLTGMRLEDNELMEDVVVVGVDGNACNDQSSNSSSASNSNSTSTAGRGAEASGGPEVVMDLESLVRDAPPSPGMAMEEDAREGSPMPVVMQQEPSGSQLSSQPTGVSSSASSSPLRVSISVTAKEEKRGRQLADGRRAVPSASASLSPHHHQQQQQQFFQHYRQQRQHTPTTPSSKPFTFSDLVVDDLTQDSPQPQQHQHQHHHHIHSSRHLRRTHSDSNAILTDDEDDEAVVIDDDELHSTPPATPIISKPRPMRRSSGSILHGFGQYHHGGQSFGMSGMGPSPLFGVAGGSVGSVGASAGDIVMGGVGSGGHHARSISVPPSEARGSMMMDVHGGGGGGGSGGMGLEGLDIAGYSGATSSAEGGMWTGLEGIGFGNSLGQHHHLLSHHNQQQQQHQQQQQQLHHLHGLRSGAMTPPAGFGGYSSSSNNGTFFGMRSFGMSTPTSPVSGPSSITNLTGHSLHLQQSPHSHSHPHSPVSQQRQSQSNPPQPRTVYPSSLMLSTSTTSNSISGGVTSPAAASPLSARPGGGANDSPGGLSPSLASGQPSNNATTPTSFSSSSSLSLLLPNSASSLASATSSSSSSSSSSSALSPSSPSKSSSNSIFPRRHKLKITSRSRSTATSPVRSARSPIGGRTTPTPPTSSLNVPTFRGTAASTASPASSLSSGYMATTPTSLTSADPYNVPYLDMHYYYGGGAGGAGSAGYAAQNGFSLLSLQQQQELQQNQLHQASNGGMMGSATPNVHTDTLNTLVGLHGDEYWLAQMEQSRPGQALDLAQSAIMASSSLGGGGGGGGGTGGTGLGVGGSGGLGFGFGMNTNLNSRLPAGGLTLSTSSSKNGSTANGSARTPTTPTKASSSTSSSSIASASGSSIQQHPSSSSTSASPASASAPPISISTALPPAASRTSSHSAGHTPPLSAGAYNGHGVVSPSDLFANLKGLDPNATIKVQRTRYSRVGIDKLQMTGSGTSNGSPAESGDQTSNGGGPDRGKGSSGGATLGRSASHHRGQSAVSPADFLLRNDNNKRKRASWDGKMV